MAGKRGKKGMSPIAVQKIKEGSRGTATAVHLPPPAPAARGHGTLSGLMTAAAHPVLRREPNKGPERR